MYDADASVVTRWRALRPELGHELTDARLQLHHAAQLVAALGISYLPARPDDSHTNFEWLDSISALASNEVNGTSPIQLALSPKPFALTLLVAGEPRATLPLHNRTERDAVAWIRQQLADCGLHTDAYTLTKHYTIPSHPVGDSAPFDESASAAFEQLGAWFANAARILERVVARTPNSSAVRCWPHHFDIATLIEVTPARGERPARTVGVGMEPGDHYYEEPYFYVNMYPAPNGDVSRPALAGGGSWHTHEWLGAVLPASRLGRDDQAAQVEAFLDSAIDACHRLVIRGADGD